MCYGSESGRKRQIYDDVCVKLYTVLNNFAAISMISCVDSGMPVDTVGLGSNGSTLWATKCVWINVWHTYLWPIKDLNIKRHLVLFNGLPWQTYHGKEYLIWVRKLSMCESKIVKRKVIRTICKTVL